MADPIPFWVLAATALVLGLRHGVDYDHISAIWDITSSQKTLRGGVVLGWFYAGGHGTVVGALGIAAVLIGLRLPPEVDRAMTVVVGTTLIILGAYVITMLVRHPNEQFQMKSRWVLIASGVLRAYEQAVTRITGRIARRRDIDLKVAGPLSAYTIGIIHGIGGETPTQILLFIIAGGISGGAAGVFVVVSFVVGVFVTNTIESVLASLGYARASSSPRLFRRVATLAAVFSLLIGLFFIMSWSGLLPPLA